jgi:hypothetical protein
MKKYTFLFLILGLLSACESPDVCTDNCANKRIRFIDDGVNFNRIIYDDNNRQINYIKGIVSASTYSYNGLDAQKTQGVDLTTYVLNDGLVPDFSLVTSSVVSSSNLINSYSYDAAGQLIYSSETQAPQVINYSHTWQNGNLILTTFKRQTGNIITYIKYEYYTDITNSMGNQFVGLQLFGKSSKNAVKRITKSFSNGNPMIITTYEYKKDLCGCITSSKETDNINVVTQKTYTYEKIVN